MEREKLIDLVQRAQQGDAEALDALFTAFYNDVYYFAMKTIKDSDTAYDVTQEAFIDIIRNIGSLQEPAAFVTWMKRITYHRCTRYFSQKKEVLVEEDEDGNSIFDTLADEGEGSIPSEVLEQKEFRKTILSMIDQLTEEQRSAVMMFYFDELTVTQIAEIQGVSDGTVKSRLNYARKAIKKSVEDYEKKHSIKLHSFSFLPLFLLFFGGKESLEKEKAAAMRITVMEAVGTNAAAVGTTTATTIIKTGTAVAKTARPGGIIMKLSTLPLWSKIIAAIVAVAIVAGAAVAVTTNNTPKDEPQDNARLETPGSSKPNKNPSEPNKEPSKPADKYESGTLVVGADNVARLYGENNTVTHTYAWEYPTVGAIPWEDKRLDITQVVILDGVTSIGAKAFYGCENLTSVTIPSSVTSIGQSAFTNCSSLTYNVYDDAEYLGNEANPYLVLVWAGTSDITSREINPNTKLIYSYAFAERTNLTSVTIPDSVTFIGDYAFSGCTSLNSVTIGNSVTSIGDSAFWRCNNLTSMTIPNSIVSIGDCAFTGCSNLSYTVYDNANYLGNETNEHLVLVSAISDNISDCSVHTSTKLIYSEAFAGCGILTSITLGSSVTSIGNNAFNSCSSLTTVTIPDSVTTIGHHAFWRCNNLTSVNLGNGVASIGASAFEECNNLTDITLPDSVISIGAVAFNNCGNLVSINIPNSVTSIGDCAFLNCSMLTGTEYGNGRYLGNGTNKYLLLLSVNTGATNYEIHPSTKFIHGYAFYDCDNLTNVTIPDGVTFIGYRAFYDCNNLTNITLPDSVTQIDKQAFFSCDNLTSVNLGNGITCISTEMFRGCTNLTSVNIPDGVTDIDYGAFDSCKNLTSITIPDSVTYIGQSAFFNCTSLSSINYNGTVAQWQNIRENENWHDVPATYVQCTDGTAEL